MSAIGRIATFTILLTVLCARIATAAGQEEDPIEPAREAVEQRRYSDAVLRLTETVRSDAEQFERAEPVYQSVVEMGQAYADKQEELTQILTRITGDVTREERLDLAQQALDLIEQMNEINPDPTQSQQQFVADTTWLLNVSLDRSDAELIMDQALALLQDGDRSGAIRAYTSGFHLQLPYFTEREDLSGDAVSRVDEARTGISNRAETFAEMLQPLIDATATALEEITDGPLDLAQIGVQTFAPPFKEAAASEARVLEAAGVLQTVHQQIEGRYQSDLLERPSWHTRLLSQFVFGRDGIEEGILAALDGPVPESIAAIVAAAKERAEREYTENVELVFAGEWDAVQRALSAAVAGARLYAQALAVEQDYPVDLSGSLDRMVIDLPDVVAVEVIRLYNSVIQASPLASLAAAMQEALAAYQQASRTIADLDRRRQGVTEQLAAIESILRSWRDARAVVDRQYGLVDAVAKDRNDRLESLFATRLAELRGYEVEIVAERASREVQPLVRRLENPGGAGMEDRYQEALDVLQNGVTGEDEITRSYPDRAKTRFETLIGDLDALSGDVERYLDGYLEEKEYIVSSRELQQPLARARDLLAEVRRLRDQAVAGAAAADEQMALARQYEAEGRELMDQAFAQLEEQEFQEATASRDAASDAFLESLEIWDRPELEDFYNARFSEFFVAFDAAKRQQVLDQVAAAIPQARRVVEQERINEYESTLATIETLNDDWQEVIGSTNTALESLIRTIQTYLEASGGRELVETDPGYPYLSTLLNRAKTFYGNAVQGAQAVGTALSQAAVALLNDADDLLQRLFQQQPQNWEGRILKVRIDLALGSGEIDRQIRQRIQEIEEAWITEEETDSTTKLQYEALYSVIQEFDTGLSQETVREIEDRIAELEELLRPVASVAAEPGAETVEQTRNILAEVRAYGPLEDLSSAELDQVLALLNELLRTDPFNQQANALQQTALRLKEEPVREAQTAATARVFRQAQTLVVRGDYTEAYTTLRLYIRDNPGQADKEINNLIRDLERRLGI